MNIKILGSGCPNCRKLEENARKAAEELGIEAEFEKVKEMKAILSYGVMSTPAMIVDGKLKVSGRVSSAEELKKHLKKSVLFLCIKNSARSQMAEIILNKKGGNRYEAYSAGSRPADSVHPLAVKVIQSAGLSLIENKPKNLNQFIDKEFDFIITLCDRMKEECPAFPGKPLLAHWGSPDPEECEGTEDEKIKCFKTVLIEISERINNFISLPVDKLDSMMLEKEVKKIGIK